MSDDRTPEQLAETIRPTLLTAHLGHPDDEGLEALDALLARLQAAGRERDEWRDLACSSELWDRAEAAEARVKKLEAALAKASEDFNVIRRCAINSRSAPNVFDSIDDFARWGALSVGAALAASRGTPEAKETE